MSGTEPELDRVKRDREFLLRLLGLGEVDDLGPFLERALALCMEVTGATRGYLEIRDDFDVRNRVRFSAHGMTESDVGEVRSRISSGIVAETLASGSIVTTDSARLDSRFEERASVREGSIEAVLCAPIGGSLSRGVVYLQDHAGGGPFRPDDCDMAEAFARHMAPFADRLLVHRRFEESNDATADLRDRYQLDEIVGRSAPLAGALEQAMLAAPINITVLITGPSGTGKTQLARAIHRNSDRADKPFVEINCAAIPAELFESELFGARAGGHSTAVRDIEGKVAAASGGSLFLDEITEVPVALQAKLLQLLQSKEYYPIGASKPVKGDIRVMAATNADLLKKVATGEFREDLYFRLNVVPIEMPALAERREDLRDLAPALLSRTVRELGLPALDLTVGAVHAIHAAEWPGNVRQLDNALQAAAVQAAGRGLYEIGPSHLFPHSDYREPSAQTFQEATRSFQRDLVQRTLSETGWNVRETAERLDIARSYVYQLIQAFELRREDEAGV